MMDSKKTTQSESSQLLEARKQSLKENQARNSMKAHGKVMDMDTFSWVNPDLDALTELIPTLHSKVIWVGCHEQIQWCLENNADLAKQIETVIIYDQPHLLIRRETLNEITNVACLQGAEFGLEMLSTMTKSKHVFLFTTSGPRASTWKADFDKFLESKN